MLIKDCFLAVPSRRLWKEEEERQNYKFTAFSGAGGPSQYNNAPHWAGTQKESVSLTDIYKWHQKAHLSKTGEKKGFFVAFGDSSVSRDVFKYSSIDQLPQLTLHRDE